MIRCTGSALPKTLIAGALLVLLALPAAAALQESRSIDTERLTVRNLIGEIRVEGHGGSEFEVNVEVKGRDAKDGMIHLRQHDGGLDIVFPGEGDFVYPAIGPKGSSSFSGNGNNWTSDLLDGGSGRVKVRGSGKGLEIWANVTVRVPNGARLEVKQAVGAIRAEGVDGRLGLSTNSGDIFADDLRGRLSVATGSGDVAVNRVQGEKISIATGSGDVEADDVDGDEFNIATGSGDVELGVIRGHDVSVATGSGDVKADALDSDEMSVATGSGEITLELEQMGNGEYSVATGSGTILLTLPAGAGAEIHAETDDGKIHVDVADASFAYREDDEVQLTVGGGGATVELATGSGEIRIRN